MDNEKLMRTVEDTKEVILSELQKLNAKKDVAPNEWDNFHKAVDILEKCMKICHMEKENEYMEYEERTGYIHHLPDESYNYTTDRHTGRRYANGRFAPMRTGHSIQDRMIDRLERMYDEAQTDHERDVIGEWIDRMRYETRGNIGGN